MKITIEVILFLTIDEKTKMLTLDEDDEGLKYKG